MQGVVSSTIVSDRRRRAVAIWLLVGVAMLMVQILLGGVTRLTGSGLSITEWKPIMGAIPPLNEHEWQEAFSKYQHIAQYRFLNAHFTLGDFKKIFFWEWLHREWARIGLATVFVIGFIYFSVKKYFDKEMIAPFVVLFVLGGFQGAIGWIMVKSGLNDTSLYVDHIKLAIHFISALILLCYTLWFALKLLVPERDRVQDKRLFRFSLLMLGLLALQLLYGAFMAGLKAASTAATWPDINGAWLPDQIHQYGELHYSGLSRFTSHPLAVQAIHRYLAYLLFCLVITWTVAAGKVAKRPGGERLRRWRWWPAALVSLQVLLGIFTVLHADHIVPGVFGTFEILAELHQLVAMGLLVSLVANLYLIRLWHLPSARSFVA